MGERWWVASSVLGLAVSSALLGLALHDEAVRREERIDGAMSIHSQASVVLKSQLSIYFALCLLASALKKPERKRMAVVLGNLVLTTMALYRLRSRQQINAWARRRDRRATDRRQS